jgi:hypothetical protein
MRAQLAVQALIALVLVLAGVGVFAVLLVAPIPSANAHQIDLALGNLEGAFATAVAFYLGSSRGSAVKDATIATAARVLEAQSAGAPATPSED